MGAYGNLPPAKPSREVSGPHVQAGAARGLQSLPLLSGDLVLCHLAISHSLQSVAPPGWPATCPLVRARPPSAGDPMVYGTSFSSAFFEHLPWVPVVLTTE